MANFEFPHSYVPRDTFVARGPSHRQECRLPFLADPGAITSHPQTQKDEDRVIELDRIYNEDCRETMKRMEDNSVDAIVTDPPAGISFMGKEWDHHKGGRDEWIKWMAGVAGDCLRILKPGGHALVWSLPRTSHWTATAWENAGFEVRDRIGHIFGSGFPKSLDVSKAIDAKAKAVRPIVGLSKGAASSKTNSLGKFESEYPATMPATAAAAWSGWGTALKPAVEDWWLLRKPPIGTVAENVLKHGTGALNVNGSRVPVDERADASQLRTVNRSGIEDPDGWGMHSKPGVGTVVDRKGRWPAHLIHDGDEEVMAIFPVTQSGTMMAGTQRHQGGGNHGNFPGEATAHDTPADFGSASRFFYCAKSSQAERNGGLEGTERRQQDESRKDGNRGSDNPRNRGVKQRRNFHPTVKPLALMEYLVRLITPPNGIVYDPFVGSGTTLVACINQDFQFIGSEAEADYCAIAQKRIDAARSQTKLAL